MPAGHLASVSVKRETKGGMRFMILCPAAIAAIETPNLGDARERKAALAKKLERHL